MNPTESAPAKPSSIDRFLSEASAPEATVKVEVTGTPATVQRAITKLARRPGAGKKPGSKAPDASEAPISDGPGDGPDAGDGGSNGPEDRPGRPGKFPSMKEKSEDVVEALIQEKS